MKILSLVLLFLSALAGCTASPSDTVKKIRERASVGDVEGVYAFFDKEKINDDLTKQIVKNMEFDDSILYKDFAIRKFKHESDDIIKSKVWDVIEEEIKKGKQGAFAGMRIVKDYRINEYNAKEIVQLGNGKETSLSLFKSDRKWVVIGLDADDAVKRRVFKKINAKPSIAKAKMKSIVKCAGNNADENFHSMIKPELIKIAGKDYERLIYNLSESGPIAKEGQYIVVKGSAPNLKGREEGIIVIDSVNRTLSAAMLCDGKTITRYSDIQDKEDYPDLIKKW